MPVPAKIRQRLDIVGERAEHVLSTWMLVEPFLVFQRRLVLARRFFVILAVTVVCLAAVADMKLAREQPTQAAAAGEQTATLSLEAQQAVIDQYCVFCHDDVEMSGNMTLSALDLAHVDENPELAEKVIRKLRAGMMPPPGQSRPDPDTRRALAASLESAIDRAAAGQPNPGNRSFQRLTRTEYVRSIRDLLGVEVDVAPFLPPDTVSDGFDNIADNQSSSPTLMEGYIRAAHRISREALGDPTGGATATTYRPPRTGSQMRHVQGAPYGTRGGMVVEHNFPADGEYVLRLLLYGARTGALFGNVVRGEQIEVAINGERVALLDIDHTLSQSSPDGLNLRTGSIAVAAGPQKVSAAFIEGYSGLVDDLVSPIEHTLADRTTGTQVQMTHRPHLRELEIKGPYTVTGMSETPSRAKVFTCRPAAPSEDAACAEEIITRLARQAFRRPPTPEDLEGLMTLYESGLGDGGFESGIRTALQAILASPRFLFRLESAPADARPGASYRLGDFELASRLSYFLWATAPDDELISVASQGRLQDPAVLERQVRRMLADPRAESLSTKFGAQWLRLSDLEKLDPDFLIYPQYDALLAQAMKRETELFFDSIVREDRSVFDLLTADYTFVNERLASHYGFPDVLGHEFRRVVWDDENRRGVLGHGSILTLTSIADRTSAVQRGKWVMEVLFGTPPPPPPPNVPELEQTAGVLDGKVLTLSERMEMHRANPACNSCHRLIDPIGLALENFDVTGASRIKDGTQMVDTRTELFDGTKVDGPAGLRQAIMNYSDAFVLTLTENLLTYGLGRRVEYPDMPMVRTIIREAAENDYRFSSLIMGIVKSPAFQMNTFAESAEN